jgi:lysophospholipase L1-like esterase
VHPLRTPPGAGRRGLRRRLVPLLAVLAAATGLVTTGPGTAPAAAADPLRLMLVGDSITSGQTLAITGAGTAVNRSAQWPTYRGPLHAKLTGGPGTDPELGATLSHDVDFVGSQSGVGTDKNPHVMNCPPSDPDRVLNVLGTELSCDYATRIGGGIPYALADPHHEGHDGWTVDEMVGQLAGWMASSQPDIVVLFGGTNDLNQGDTPAGVVAEMRQAVNIVQSANPAARIVVAQIPPHKDTQARTDLIAQYNSLVAAVVDETTATSKVILADLFGGYCANTHPDPRWDSNGPSPLPQCDGIQYNNDGSHPNPLGGRFIARRLGDAMQAAGFFDPSPSPPPPRPPPPTNAAGYVLVEHDGDLYAFGSARARLKVIDPGAVDNNARGVTTSGIVKSRMGGAAAIDVETTADAKGLWVLLSNGAIVNLGTASPVKGVGPGVMTKTVAGQPERPASLARVGSSLWVFTSAGRIVPQIGALPAGAVTAMNQVLALSLVGPILDAKPTKAGTGAYATGDDGGVFAYNAPFRGSVPGALAAIGRTRPDQPVVGVTVDPDGDGYWLVAQDGGVFAFAAPFRGSLPAIVPFFALLSPVNGMVPFGNGYLLVAGDGGVFNFSNLPFSGSASGLVDTTVVGITSI